MTYHHQRGVTRKSRVLPALKTIFWLVLITGATIYCIVVIGWLNEGNAERQEAELCQKYTYLPETQVDRIPDGCVPYYYQNR